MKKRPAQAFKVVPLTLILTLTLISRSVHSRTNEQEVKEGEEHEGCLPDVPCTPGFHVGFDDQELKCGQNTEPDLANKEPDMELEVTEERLDGRKATFDSDEPEKLLVVMVDPDAPSVDQCPQTYWLHWMTLAKLQGGTVTPTENIVGYKGPNPPPAQRSPHRYQLLLYSMEDKREDSSDTTARERSNFDLQTYLSMVGLDNKPLASFQFLAEN